MLEVANTIINMEDISLSIRVFAVEFGSRQGIEF